MSKNITSQTFQRLPVYFNYLVSLPETRKAGNISATAIAEALGLNDVQVRKDLASVSRGGRPKIGYVTSELISDIGNFLGLGNSDKVIVAGMGSLGKALLEDNGFSDYGFNIVCGFSSGSLNQESEIDGKPVLNISELKNFCKSRNIKIGIITVSDDSAQEVCNMMAEAGIQYILSFASVHLNAPKDVIIHNENISLTLAMLTRFGG